MLFRDPVKYGSMAILKLRLRCVQNQEALTESLLDRDTLPELHPIVFVLQLHEK